MSNQIKNNDHKNTIEFLTEPNEEDYLWRYMDLNKFLSFIIEKKLHLSRFDQLEDAHEGAPVEKLLKNLALIKIERESKSQLEQILLNLTVRVSDGLLKWSKEAEAKLYQHLYFTNCWIIGKRESMAMWTAYSTKDSVAIKIKYKHLKDVIANKLFTINELNDFYKMIVGKIEYIDFLNLDEEIAEVVDKVIVGFHKDLSFQHENEFRICLVKSDPDEIFIKQKEKKSWTKQDENDLNTYTGLSLVLNDFEKIPFEIVFHPKADEFSKTNIRNLLKRIDINFKISSSEITLR